MKVALDKGTLKDYILAANDLTEDMLASLENKRISYLNVFYKWTNVKYFNLLH